jgi:hypothetical protein
MFNIAKISVTVNDTPTEIRKWFPSIANPDQRYYTTMHHSEQMRDNISDYALTYSFQSLSHFLIILWFDAI